MKLTTRLIALSLAATAGMASADSTLRFGIEAEYPPFESKNAAGQLEGFDVDLGNAICAKAKLKCSWVENAFDSLIPALEAKKFDAINSAMNATDKRREAIDFTDTIYRIPTQLIGKAGSKMAPTAAGLKGKNVGVLQGSIQETFAKAHWEPNGVTVTAYKDQNMVYADLASGRLDATLVMAAAGQAGFLSKPEGKGYAFIGAPVKDDKILGSGIAFGLRKGDEARKKQLNAAIAEVKKDGTVAKLAQKYFSGFDVTVK